MSVLRKAIQPVLRKPLHGPFAAPYGGDLENYAVNGKNPDLVAAFNDAFYYANGATRDADDFLTFARASTATYVDSNGTLQTAASGEPRDNHHIYNGTSWVNEGRRFESEARTNLATYSNKFNTTSAWFDTNFNATTTSAAATSPDGTTNAWQITDDGSTGTGVVGLRRTVQSVAAGSVTLSCFAKANGSNFLALSLYSYDVSVFANGMGYFDLSSGVVASTGSGVDQATIEDFGGGWYRCSVTIATTTDLSGSAFVGLADSNGGAESVTLDGASSIYVFGAQLEQASAPSSYIPTAGATATRAAETLTGTASFLPYSATAMAIALEGRITYADEGAAAQLVFDDWELDASNRIELALDTDSTDTGQAAFIQEAAGTEDSVRSAAGAYSPGVNVAFNIASRHTDGDINGAVDGTALTADTTPTALPDLSATDIQIAPTFMGTLKSLRMWDEALTDTELEEATS